MIYILATNISKTDQVKCYFIRLPCYGPAQNQRIDEVIKRKSFDKDFHLALFLVLITSYLSGCDAVHRGRWQEQTELRSERTQTRCQDEKSLHWLGLTDQQQCAVTRGWSRLTPAVTGSDSTGTPECTQAYAHRATAVSSHLAPCCTTRALINWHRQTVQFIFLLTLSQDVSGCLYTQTHTEQLALLVEGKFPLLVINANIYTNLQYLCESSCWHMYCTVISLQKGRRGKVNVERLATKIRIQIKLKLQMIVHIKVTAKFP